MIDFGHYRYIGNHTPGDDESKYNFDKNYYQNLLRDNRYRDAADYLSKYEFIDSEEQIKHLRYIDELRDNGEIINAVYSRIENEQDKNLVEFADKVGKQGWYNSIRYKTDSNGDYIYANDEEFRKANPDAAFVVDKLEEIGSSPLHKATRLSITFDPIKYGLGGINWSKRNDTDDLDTFYNNGKFTKEKLIAAGVDISLNDKTGKTTISFDKSNPMAPEILAALPVRHSVRNMVDIKGYYADDNGNYIQINQEEDLDKSHESVTPFYNRGDAYIKSENFRKAIEIKNCINNARNNRDKVFEKRELEDYEISSTVFDLTTDRTDLLKEMFAAGQLSEGEYNRRMKDAKDLVGWLRGQTYLNGVYSNINNKEFTDEHFETIGQDEWFQIKNALGEFEDKDVIIQGQTIDGELGIRVTLPQAQRKKRLASTEEGGFLHTDKRNIQFFIPASAIPGMLGELQKQIDNNTALQAEQDFNNMVGYGIKKTLYNGEKIYVDDLGNIIRESYGKKTYDDTPDAKNRAINDLNQTRIIEKGRYLKFQHINSNGDLNYVTYEEDAKRFAIRAANDLNSAPLKDFNGKSMLSYNSDYTINYGDLFDPTLDLSNYQSDVVNKILKIREIYNTLMDEVYNYNAIEY